MKKVISVRFKENGKAIILIPVMLSSMPGSM